MSISVEIVGDDRGVLEMLNVLDTALNPVAIAQFLGATVDPYVRQRAAKRFAKEGDDVTGKWQPLSEATVAIREQMGYGAGPINFRTGELKDYITQVHGNTNIFPWGASLTLPGDAGGDAELSVKFKHAQQGGVSDAGKPFPARPVLGLNEADLVYVLTALAGYINTAGKARGIR